MPLQGFDQGARQRVAAEHDGGAFAEEEQNGHHKMKAHGEHPADDIAGGDAEPFVCGIGALQNGFVGKDHALARAGRARRETDEGRADGLVAFRRWAHARSRS